VIKVRIHILFEVIVGQIIW